MHQVEYFFVGLNQVFELANNQKPGQPSVLPTGAEPLRDRTDSISSGLA